MKNIIVILFGLMCIAQWIVPGKMIYDSEHIITTGTAYKFKTAPIDPSDIFRGKFIILNFESNFFNLQDSVTWQPGEPIFVTFTTDSLGHAEVENISKSTPDTEAYLQTTVDYVTDYTGEHKVWFKLPFNRFYMEESKAPRAEQLYRDTQGDSSQIAYALVIIGKGQAVLKDVIINDKPVIDLINALKEE